VSVSVLTGTGLGTSRYATNALINCIFDVSFLATFDTQISEMLASYTFQAEAAATHISRLRETWIISTAKRSEMRARLDDTDK
jgi:hypothetical protein